jgi:hypothetical protein
MAPAEQLCREAGISRSRFYELRHRYERYGEAGLPPKPRPTERPAPRPSAPLVDAVLSCAIEHVVIEPVDIAAPELGREALAVPVGQETHHDDGLFDPVRQALP